MERAAAYAGTLQEHNVESAVPLNNNRGLIVTLIFLLPVCLDPRGVRAAAHRTVMSAPTFPCDNEE